MATTSRRRHLIAKFVAGALVLGAPTAYLLTPAGIPRLVSAVIDEVGESEDARRLLRDVFASKEGWQMFQSLRRKQGATEAVRGFLEGLAASKGRAIVAAAIREIQTDKGKELIGAYLAVFGQTGNEAKVIEALEQFKRSPLNPLIDRVLTSDGDVEQHLFTTLSNLSKDEEIRTILKDAKAIWETRIKGKPAAEVLSELRKPDVGNLITRAWKKLQTGPGLEFVIAARQAINEDANFTQAMQAIDALPTPKLSPVMAELDGELSYYGQQHSLTTRMRGALRAAVDDFAHHSDDYSDAAGDPSALIIKFLQKHPEILDISILKTNPPEMDDAKLAELNALQLGHHAPAASIPLKSGFASPEGTIVKTGDRTFHIALARGSFLVGEGNDLRCGYRYTGKTLFRGRPKETYDKGFPVSITELDTKGNPINRHMACVVGISQGVLHNIEGIKDPSYIADAAYLFGTKLILSRGLKKVAGIMSPAVNDFVKAKLVEMVPGLKSTIESALTIQPDAPKTRRCGLLWTKTCEVK